MNFNLFDKTEKLLTDYCELNESNLQIIDEIVSRLRTVRFLCESSLQLNSTLLENNEELNELEKNLEKVDNNFILNMLKEGAKKDEKLATWLKQNGPNLRISEPVKTSIAPYNLTDLKNDNSDYSNKLKLLHINCESIYNNLWAVKEKLNNIKQFSEFNPPLVRDVRNHLIVHTDGKSSKALIFSFGLHTNGPVLRPTRPLESQAHNDQGLTANVEEFLNKIISTLE